MVPKGWELRELKELTTIYDGTHATPKYVESGVPFYSVEHLTKGDFSKTKFITEEVFDKENKRVKLERHDILMTRIGDIGTAVHLDWDVRASFYVSLALLKASSNFDSSFMTQYINSSEFHRELWKRIIHVAFPKKINLGEIGKCHVCLPHLPEQRKIAAILGTWDKAISTTERLIDNSKQQKKALMQQLLTGKKRLLDDSGRPFEGEWEELKLKECATCLDNKRIPLNSSQRQEMQGETPYWGANGIVDYINEHIFDETIVLLAEDGGYFDEFSHRPIANISYGKSWVNNHAHILKAKNNSLNEWLYYSLVHKNILDLINGGTRAKLNKSDMLLIPINLPPIAEQRKIVSVLSNADQEISLLEKQFTDLKQEKKALMQQLLTGKRRVKIDDKEVA